MDDNLPSPAGEPDPIDALAQEIRIADGNRSLGAGALAEALTPFIRGYTFAKVEQAISWQPMSTAPTDGSVVLLRVPTRAAKWALSMASSGRWAGGFWVIFNADEAVQRVQPNGWMPDPAKVNR